MADSIDLCREKLQRAEGRLDELKAAVDKFFARDDPHEIPGDYDPKTTRFTFYLKLGDPPVVLDAIIGEIAHGLRSALNNLASALSSAPDGKTDFPIFIDETDFIRRGRPAIRTLSARHRDAIECLQPYQRAEPADAPLAILNTLARVDKHREGTFQVIANVYASMTFRAVRDISGYGEASIYAGVMKDGDPLAVIEVIPSGPHPEMHIHAEFAAGIAFAQRWTLPHPFPRLMAEVRDIVDALATT
jgi:hypothetical protein